MQCIMCDKPAKYTASGNTYCLDCYRKSPYYAEIEAKRRLYAEKKAKEK